MEVIPDPSTVHFHLPNNLSVRVHREYADFLTELTTRFPHEKEGILKFYGECWKVSFSLGFVFILTSSYCLPLTLIIACTMQVFNALNSLELKSLEEPLYLFGQFFQKPLECLTLGKQFL